MKSFELGDSWAHSVLQQRSTAQIVRLTSQLAATTLFSKDLFVDPEYQQYLDHLTSCSLDTLKNEPASLTREATRLQQQLADLAYTEYRSFLRANDCTRTIQDTFAGLEDRIGALTDMLPDLEKACTTFATSTARDVLKDRRREHLVLNQHSKLVEILEIPQLMDTLIRNGYYDEAMDLQTHVQRLVLRHPDYKLLRSVAGELDAATKVMLTQLVNLLKGDVKLPLCIRVMGYLRRMEAVPEPELRLIFLQQRDQYFKKHIDETCGTKGLAGEAVRDQVEYVRKYIDVYRECFFDIVAQYRAIFSDATSATASRTSGSNTISKSTLVYDTAAHATLTHSILASYAMQRIQQLVATLQAHLPHINDASQIASLCTQTMYFGMSLGRVGIDFRAIVAGQFEDAVEAIVLNVVGSGVRQFLDWIAETRAATGFVNTSDIAAAAPKLGRGTGLTNHPFLRAIYVKHSAPPVLSKAAAPSTPDRARPNSQPAAVQAPPSLLAHPPFAHLLNAFFAGYNQLRCLPSLRLQPRIQSVIATQLSLCSNALSDAFATWWDDWTQADRLVGVLAATAWSFVLVPAILDGFEVVYGDSTALPKLTADKFTSSMERFLDANDLKQQDSDDGMPISSEILAESVPSSPARDGNPTHEQALDSAAEAPAGLEEKEPQPAEAPQPATEPVSDANEQVVVAIPPVSESDSHELEPSQIRNRDSEPETAETITDASSRD
ncbi:conserved oligomeric Golgi complex component [Thoreauomyces humboldtii]|nr:conserved oligomeric Golgi complex component [Thoreauomyces humboldtii]